MGAVSAAALPPLYVIPALLIAAPGLLMLIDGARGPGGAARRGFWFGLGHHIFGLYWITEAILLESARYWWLVPLAVPALSALLALFIAVPCAAAKLAAPGWRRVAVFAGAWVLADIARQYIGTGFPWNPWGSVWTLPGLAGDIMIQPAALIGTPGLTLATVLLASTPYLGARAVAGAAVVVLLWAGAGWYRWREPEPRPTGMQAVLVQGNIAQGQKWDQQTMLAAFERQLALTREGMAQTGGQPAVVIWPETSVAFLLQYDPAARAAIMQAAKPAVAALVGGLTFNAPPSRDTLDTNPPYNSLIALTPDAAIAGIYSKWHLVPFGEFAPSWVPFSIKVVPGQLGFGSGPRTLHILGLPAIGPLICYEAVYPAQVIDEADRPALMVNITNDAWFGNSTGPRQHFAAARLRAVEEGLPLLRAANSGITGAFDARGRELARTVLNTASVLTVPIPGARPATSFSRWGLVIPGLLSLVCLGLGLRRAR
jgi:apolipoprotein N-acyltransferase